MLARIFHTVFALSVCLVAYAEDILECGELPLVEKTVIGEEEESYPVGTVVEYNCEFGYVPSNYRRSVTCVEVKENNTAVWTQPDFHCIPRSCGDPGFVSYARRNGSVFTFPNRVAFICDEGYKLEGPNQRFCQTNGQWSGKLPSCKKVECRPPSSILNGRVIYDSLEYGTELRYECDSGFMLKSSGPRICIENGTWSGKRPKCLESRCKNPEAPLHGAMEIVGGESTVGSIAIYTCDDGYNAVGSTTSKCLSSGDWMFPPPRCLDSCRVPKVEQGKIGIYEGRYTKRFKKLSIGQFIESGKEMVLKCDNKNYEPAGKPYAEMKITCSNGQWSLEPVCEPASCRSAPPALPNAVLVTLERHHDVVLTYKCNSNFEKSAFGSMKCVFGSWVGKLPVCTDTRCLRSTLNFVGLKHSGREKYSFGQILIPECIDGYELSKPGDQKLTCMKGEWQGYVPPCKPAKCRESPPSPQNGHVKDYTGNHGSNAILVCDPWYQLSSNVAALQCSFGKWKLDNDACYDTRCHLINLQEKDGVDMSNLEPTFPGNYGKIECLEGYSLKYSRPRCLNGTWQIQNNYSPCQPSPCIVHKVENGEFRYLKTYQKYNWLYVRYDTIDEYIEERIGATYNHGSGLYVSCTKPYIFQGKFTATVVKVECSKGKWKPEPVCLLRGASMPVPAKAQNARTSISVNNRAASVSSPIPTTLWVTPENILQPKSSVRVQETTTSVNLIETVQMDNSTILESSTEDNPLGTNKTNCSCTYILDDKDVIAHSGMEQLHYGSKIKEGCTVQFTCQFIGFHRLVGESELRCENCTWHSSQYPSCVKPREGDAQLAVTTANSSLISVTTSGVILIPKGLDVNISCTLTDLNEWPTFVDLPKDIPLHYRTAETSNSYVLWGDLMIKNIDTTFSGKYECKSLRGFSNHIEIQVLEPTCPDILSTSLTVTYSNERKLHSQAYFQCLDRFKVLKGPSEVTCLPTEKWSHKTPSCLSVICSMKSLMEQLPENVVPQNEDVTGPELPYSSIVRLECERPTMRAVGTSNVTCTETGEWLIGSVECVPGCGPVQKTKSSNLQVEPDKDIYRFGDIITFSCPPGLSLNSSTEVMICLHDGWSEEKIPICENL